MEPQYVTGEVKMPFWRGVGCRLAAPFMRLGVPGASWLYFRCLLGPGIRFTVHTLETGR